MKYIIQKSLVNSPEARAIQKACYLENKRFVFMDGFDEKFFIPIGSVEFLRTAFDFLSLEEPENISYPECLRKYLSRELIKTKIGDIIFPCFIKPVKTKLFNAFYFEPEIYKNAFFRDREVWASEFVKWKAEVRFYVLKNEIIGFGRYDSGHDYWIEPSLEFAREVVKTYKNEGSPPIGYAVDLGYIEGKDEPSLIEVNDAWALGYYIGTLHERDYLELLTRRWEEIFYGFNKK